jgi:hypothetical protein
MITIGNSQVFDLVKIVANSLNIPYLTIRSDNQLITDSSINFHPPVLKLNEALIDMICYYKWKFVTLIFQDPNQFENLIQYASNKFFEHKIRFQYKVFSQYVYYWKYLLKEIIDSRSTHIIIELNTHMISKFLRIV